MGQQSDYIFGALIIAFLLFITAKNELPIYLGFLLKSGTSNSTAPTNQSNSLSSTVSTIGQIGAALAGG